MGTRATLTVGVCGVAIGLLAAATEAMPALGFSGDIRAAVFRVLSVLSIVILLSGILYSVVRPTRTAEQQQTEAKPVVDAFLLGYSMRGRPDGGGLEQDE